MRMIQQSQAHLFLREEHMEDETQPSAPHRSHESWERVNVIQCRDEVLHQWFSMRKKIVTVFGHMQSGKMNAICSTAKGFVRERMEPGESFEDAFKRLVIFITGYSSINLKNESIDKILDVLGDDGLTTEDLHYFHRNDLNTVQVQKLCEYAKARGALIIIDEVHIASEQGMNMDTLLRRTGLLSQLNDVKVLCVSATPSACLVDCWAYECHALVCLSPGEDYVGVQKLLDMKCAREAKDLSRDPTGCLDLVGEIISRWGVRELPKIHILRVKFTRPTAQAIRKAERLGKDIQTECRFQKYLKRALRAKGFDKSDYRILNHNQEDRMMDVERKLDNGVSRHTFVLIKDFWRCGSTLPKKHLGVFYESKVNEPDDNTVAQGGLGRLCGYWQLDENTVEKAPLVYTCIRSARRWLASAVELCDPVARESKILHMTQVKSRSLTVKEDKSIHFKPSIFSAREDIHSKDVQDEYAVYTKQLKKPNTKRSHPYRVAVARRKTERKYQSSEPPSHSESFPSNPHPQDPASLRRALNHLQDRFGEGESMVSLERAVYPGLVCDMLVIQIHEYVNQASNMIPAGVFADLQMSVNMEYPHWCVAPFQNPLSPEHTRLVNQIVCCRLAGNHKPVRLSELILAGGHLGVESIVYDQVFSPSKICMVLTRPAVVRRPRPTNERSIYDYIRSEVGSPVIKLMKSDHRELIDRRKDSEGGGFNLLVVRLRDYLTEVDGQYKITADNWSRVLRIIAHHGFGSQLHNPISVPTTISPDQPFPCKINRDKKLPYSLQHIISAFKATWKRNKAGSLGSVCYDLSSEDDDVARLETPPNKPFKVESLIYVVHRYAD